MNIDSKQHNILFLNPAFPPHLPDCIPIGIANLISYARKFGYDAGLYDFNLLGQASQSEIVKEIHSLEPLIICISCNTKHAVDAYTIANLYKAIDKSIVFIYGGIHPTFKPLEPFERGCADYVVRGEGEVTLIELFRYLYSGNICLEEIHGISYRTRNQTVVHNAPRALLSNLNIIPKIDHSTVKYSEYDSEFHIEHEPYSTVSLMTSRGCYGQCGYCCAPFMWRQTLRYYSTDYITDQIERFYNNGIKHIHFHDDNFMTDRDRIVCLCNNLIERNIDIHWICLSDVLQVIKQQDVLKRMKEAGCIAIELGLEGYDDEILNYLGKSHRTHQAFMAVDILKKSDIDPLVLMMNYCIGETVDSPFRAYSFLRQIHPVDVNCVPGWDSERVFNSSMRISPGCQLYENIASHGMLLCEDWDDHYQERISFLPHTLLCDSVVLCKGIDKDSIADIIEKRREFIEFLAKQNFYCNFSTIDNLIGFEQFVRLLPKIASACERITVRELLQKRIIDRALRDVDIVGLQAAALSVLSVLQIVTSENSKGGD